MSDLRPYTCLYPDCSEACETYVTRLDFSRHERRTHKFRDTCVFCEKKFPMFRRREHSRHLGRHMEEIAFMVVTKPYEDWDFYSDASSGKYQGTHKLRKLNLPKLPQG